MCWASTHLLSQSVPFFTITGLWPIANSFIKRYITIQMVHLPIQGKLMGKSKCLSFILVSRNCKVIHETWFCDNLKTVQRLTSWIRLDIDLKMLILTMIPYQPPPFHILSNANTSVQTILYWLKNDEGPRKVFISVSPTKYINKYVSVEKVNL